MDLIGRLAVRLKWFYLIGWLLLAVLGISFAAKATAALSYDFSLPGQPGYSTNAAILKTFGSGGDNAPILVNVHNVKAVKAADATAIASALHQRLPDSRIISYAQSSALLASNAHDGFIVIFPKVESGPEPYAKALPLIEKAVRQARLTTGTTATVSGEDVLADSSGSGGANVLIETIFGGLAALVILVLVFGSFLAITPLLIAACSILTTFLCVYGLTRFTEVSFIVQYLLALIGLGVAIDYALLLITRWREEQDRGASNETAVVVAVKTAGRSLLFSGLTVAVSLAALIALPVPFLRSVGYTGLLIPIVSVLASLTLLPALLLTVGPKLAWPHRRSGNPSSRLWKRVGTVVVGHRWLAATAAIVLLLLLALPLVKLHLGNPSNRALASFAGQTSTASQAISRLDSTGIGSGLSQPVEILTTDPDRVTAALSKLSGTHTTAPWAFQNGRQYVMGAWSADDVATVAGTDQVKNIRRLAENAGAQVGGVPVQNIDFIAAVYGHAGWVVLAIVIVTFLLLARALRSIVLPIKALLLNVFSIGAAYGITILIWQFGFGTQLLFGQSSTGAVTVWVPIAVFAFLFGLSMDYEVFLLSRIREEYDGHHDTDKATIAGVAYTGRLVSSAALILFCAFISLSRVPSTDVKILATALALGIIIDATLVRGVLAPALVAGLGRANWWHPWQVKHKITGR